MGGRKACHWRFSTCRRSAALREVGLDERADGVLRYGIYAG